MGDPRMGSRYLPDRNRLGRLLARRGLLPSASSPVPDMRASPLRMGLSRPSCTHTHTHIQCTHTHARTYTHTHTHTMYTHAHTHTRTHTHNVHTSRHAHTHTHTRMRAHTHTHTHTHTQCKLYYSLFYKTCLMISSRREWRELCLCLMDMVERRSGVCPDSRLVSSSLVTHWLIS